MTTPSQAALDVLAERKRQIDIENFHPNWDNKYTGGQLARAANTAVAIAMAHREIASAENLLKDLPPPQTEQAA